MSINLPRKIEMCNSWNDTKMKNFKKNRQKSKEKYTLSKIQSVFEFNIHFLYIIAKKK